VVVEVPHEGQQVKPYPKGGAAARRTIGLPGAVVQVLTEHLSGRQFVEPLWPSLNGGRQWYGQASRCLRAAYTRAQITEASGFHTLRRTAATLALQQAASIRDVQAMLGHKSPVMTLTRYAQADVDQQRAATGRVADTILTAAPRTESGHSTRSNTPSTEG